MPISNIYSSISIHFAKIPDNSTKTRNIPSNYVIQTRKSIQSKRSKLYTGFIISFPSFFFAATLVLSSLRHLLDDRKFATIGQRALNRSPDILSVPGLGNKLFLAVCKQSLSSRFTTRNPFFQVIAPSERVKVGAELSSVQHQLKCDVSSKNYSSLANYCFDSKSIHQLGEGLRQILGCRL